MHDAVYAAQQRKLNTMKNTLLVAVGAIAMLTATGTACAADSALSPRAKANLPSQTSGGGTHPDLVRGKNDPGVAAIAKASGAPSTVVGASSNDPDLVRGQWTKAGSPRGLQQTRESGREFQVAPLK